MARRGKNNKGLAGAPWQLSVVVAGIVFATMRWLVPALFVSPAMVHLADAISEVAPMASLPFLFLACISFFRGKSRAASAAMIKNTYQSRDREPRQMPSNSESGRYSALGIPPTDWSLSLLRSLEWKRFEMLSAEYFRM